MASDEEDGIFKVETVPPPEGETDVYNAPTRVGVLAGSIVEEIVQQARRQAGTASSDSPPSDGEPAVVDPMKLLAVEQLAARGGAALRPAAVPSDDLGIPQVATSTTISTPAAAPSTPPSSPLSSPPSSNGAHGLEPTAPPPPAPLDADAAGASGSAFPFAPPPSIVPAAPPLVDPAPAAQTGETLDTPSARRPNRLVTVVMLVLIVVCLAFGIHRLRR